MNQTTMPTPAERMANRMVGQGFPVEVEMTLGEGWKTQMWLMYDGESFLIIAWPAKGRCKRHSVALPFLAADAGPLLPTDLKTEKTRHQIAAAIAPIVDAMRGMR